MGTGTHLHGSVHCHQVKTLDWEARKAAFSEKASPVVVKEVIDCLIAVLEDD
jgi:mRNA interferase ChpB